MNSSITTIIPYGEFICYTLNDDKEFQNQIRLVKSWLLTCSRLQQGNNNITSGTPKINNNTTNGCLFEQKYSKQIKPLMSLPFECNLIIISFMDSKSLVNTTLTSICAQLHINVDYYWESLCKFDYGISLSSLTSKNKSRHLTSKDAYISMTYKWREISGRGYVNMNCNLSLPFSYKL